MKELQDLTPIETIDWAIRDACARSDYVSAETIFRYALKECEQNKQLDDRLLGNLHALADKHCRHGRINEARRLVNLGLEVRSAVLGLEHPDVADSRERLNKIAKQARQVRAEAIRLLLSK